MDIRLKQWADVQLPKKCVEVSAVLSLALVTAQKNVCGVFGKQPQHCCFVWRSVRGGEGANCLVTELLNSSRLSTFTLLQYLGIRSKLVNSRCAVCEGTVVNSRCAVCDGIVVNSSCAVCEGTVVNSRCAVCEGTVVNSRCAVCDGIVVNSRYAVCGGIVVNVQCVNGIVVNSKCAL